MKVHKANGTQWEARYGDDEIDAIGAMNDILRSLPDQRTAVRAIEYVRDMLDRRPLHSEAASR